ncbi:MAG TPA: hypothetical protein VFN57_06900 [Thermomicrobiaceae bacterium]|nr:hypothetical protein [Thermomicrobiaceae bacterium]
MPIELLREWLACDEPARDAALVALLPDPAARRWLRGSVLPHLPLPAAARLAARLLAFPGDFAAMHRDRTTPNVVAHLDLPAVVAAAPFLAGSNAAGALWERLAREGTPAVVAAARAVFAAGTLLARRNTIAVLLVDRFPPVALPPEARADLLALGLADPDDETRGLAADVAAGEAPALLLPDRDRWVRDPAERARVAAWDAAFADDTTTATAAATVLARDAAAPRPARESALLVLGEHLVTEEVEDLLTEFVVDPDEGVAAAAAALLWSRHRSPVVAMAAARSPHASVRAIAERLLHPTLGSPTAGGFRPGAADQGFDLYGQFQQEMRRKPAQEP